MSESRPPGRSSPGSPLVGAVHDRGFIEADPQAVLAILAAPERYGAWWPGVSSAGLTDGTPEIVVPGLGRARVRTSFERPGADPGVFLHLDGEEVQGRLEWWLQPHKEGTVVNALLGLTLARRWGRRREYRYRASIRRAMVALKDRLEAGPSR